MHYGPFFAEYIKGVFEYDRKGKNQECKDLTAYNSIAEKIMKHMGVPVMDLYGFTMSLDEHLHEDHVHYFEPVKNLYGAFITGSILALEQKGEI